MTRPSVDCGMCVAVVRLQVTYLNTMGTLRPPPDIANVFAAELMTWSTISIKKDWSRYKGNKLTCSTAHLSLAWKNSTSWILRWVLYRWRRPQLRYQQTLFQWWECQSLVCCHTFSTTPWTPETEDNTLKWLQLNNKWSLPDTKKKQNATQWVCM